MEANTAAQPAIKNIMEIRNQLSQNLIGRENKKQELIDKINKLNFEIAVREQVLNTKISPIAVALEKMGLGITSVGYHKTGLNSNVWSEGDRLSVSISAVPTSGKFKFLTFAGYTASGSGRNQERLDAKGQKISDAIKAETGIESVRVNPFSLEKNPANRTDKVKHVLIEIYI